MKMDEILTENKEYEVIGQIGSGKYEPVNFKQFFRFKKKVGKYYQWADLIISHGGAGTLFDILSNNKKSILVPNRELVADHQIELISIFNKLGYIIKGELGSLGDLIKSINNYNIKQYRPAKNKISDLILKFINNISSSEPYK